MDSQDKNLQEQPQSSDPTTARDADRDYRYSEQFRAACEARWVLSKPISERRQYLAGVGEKRGAAARQYLERVILEEWKKKAPAKGG